jgi:hypothetical protein
VQYTCWERIALILKVITNIRFFTLQYLSMVNTNLRAVGVSLISGQSDTESKVAGKQITKFPIFTISYCSDIARSILVSLTY